MLGNNITKTFEIFQFIMHFDFMKYYKNG